MGRLRVIIEIEILGGVTFVETKMPFDDFMEMFTTGWYLIRATGITHKVVKLTIHSENGNPDKTILFD